MRRAFLLIFILSIMTFPGYGQKPAHGSISVSRLNSTGGQEGIHFQVIDSVSNNIISNAMVTVAGKKDSVSFLSGSTFKMESIPHQILRDSVHIEVSYLGYYAIRTRLMLMSPASVTVRMSERNIAVGEIVVIGKTLAIVTKGDTVQFNKAGFKTLEGDMAGELFASLPGVTLQQGQLKFQGRNVQKIYVDQTSLFGDNVEAVLKNLTADDIVNVKFYEEDKEWNKLNKIQGDEKITVADVTTKNKPKSIGSTTLSAKWFGKLNKEDNSSQYKNLYRFQGESFYTRVGRQIEGKVDIGDDLFAGNKIKDQSATFNYTKEQVNKYKFSFKNSFRHEQKWVDESSFKDYYPTAEYDSRTETTNKSQSPEKYAGKSSLYYDKTFTDKSNLAVSADFTYNKDIDDDVLTQLSTLNGEQLNSVRMNQHNENQNLGITGKIAYRKYFERRKINLSSDINASVSYLDGEALRMDTLALNGKKLHAADTTNTRYQNYSWSLNIVKTISPTVQLGFSYNIGYSHERSEKNGFNLITNSLDSVNTHNYTYNYLKNRATLTVSFNFWEDAVLSVWNAWANTRRMQDEFFPETSHRVKHFNSYEPLVSFQKRKFDIVFSRSVNLDALAIRDIINVLDTRNPLVLKAGNPNLDIPVNHILSIKYSIFKKPVSISFRSQYQITTNSVVTKRQFFDQDTYLEEYNYLAAAGSVLETKVNSRNQSEFNFTLELSSRINPLRTTVTLIQNYSYRKSPQPVGDMTYMRERHTPSSMIIINGNFSQYLRLRINCDYTYDISRYSDYKSTYQNLRISSTAEAAYAGFKLLVTPIYTKSMTSAQGSSDRFNLSAELSKDFIPSRPGKVLLSVFVNNILNKKPGPGYGVFNDYIETRYQSFIGRTGGMRFSVKL